MNGQGDMRVTVCPSRLRLTDAHPSLSYRIFVDGADGKAPWVELAFAGTPDLLAPGGRSRRTPHNFFSTRDLGRLPARRGEALFILPPWVLGRLAGERRLYHGLAVYGGPTDGVPLSVETPTESAVYVDLSGFTGATVRRAFGAPNPRGGLIRYAPGAGTTEEARNWAGDAPVPGTRSLPEPPAAARGQDPSSAPPPVTPPSPTTAVGISTNFQMGHKAMQQPGHGILHQSNYRNGATGQQPPSPSPAGGPQGLQPAPTQAQTYRAEEYDDGYGAWPTTQGLSDWLASTTVGSFATELLGFLRRVRERAESFVVGVPATSFFPFSAICHIDGATGSGTGFYIAYDKILTAAHVVQGESRLTITAGKNGSGDTGRVRFTVTSADWTQHNLYDGGGAYDLAVIRVTPPPPDGHYFKLINYSPTPDTPLAVCGYGSTCDSTSIDGDKQHVDVGRLGALEEKGEVMNVAVLACAGHSGSPAFVEGPIMSGHHDPAAIPVMGVLVSGSSDSDNDICLLTPDKIDWANAGGLMSASQAYAAPQGVFAAPGNGVLQPRFARPASQGDGIPYPARSLDGADDTLGARSLGELIRDLLDRFRAVAQRARSFVVGVPDTSFFPFSSICHLELTFGGDTYFGTGFYITSDRILTVGHNLYDRDRGTEADQVRIRAGRNGASQLSDFTVSRGHWLVHDGYKTHGGPDHDLAVIYVNNAPPGGNAFDLIDFSPVADTPVAICGHGMRNYNNEVVLDHTKQHLDIGLIGSLLPSGEAMHMKVLGMRGHSGSPCFVDGGLASAAVSGGADPKSLPVMGVLSQIDQSHESYICRLTPDKVQWALGQSLPQYAGGMGYATPQGGPVWVPVVTGLVQAATSAGIAALQSASGDIAWSLQRMDGWLVPGQHPTPKIPVPPATIKTREVGLESPVYDGTLGDVYAHFRLRFGYDGTGLGQVLVDPSPYAVSDPIGKGLKVRMQIEPLNGSFPAQGDPNSQVAAVRVTMHYEYEHAVSDSTFLQYVFTLYGDGTFESRIDDRVGPLSNISINYAPGHPYER